MNYLKILQELYIVLSSTLILSYLPLQKNLCRNLQLNRFWLPCSFYCIFNYAVINLFFEINYFAFEIMIELRERHCFYDGKLKLLNRSELEGLKAELSSGWKVLENKKLYKKFSFENYQLVMAFAQDVAALAEQENHHPDMCIHYRSVEVEFSTHSHGGLTENDFIMAAKIEEL